MTEPTERDRETALMRGALSDAARLCDALAVEIGKNNPGRRKGSVSFVGLALQSVAKSCGDAIWAMREKVSVPMSEPPAERGDG